MSHSVFLELYREFCRNLVEENFAGEICYNHLNQLDESLPDPEEVRRKRLNDLAGSMVDFAQDHFRSDIRREFQSLRNKEERAEREVERFGSKVSAYESLFREILSELRRFNENHPLKPISEDTIEEARKGFAHFNTLGSLYLELLCDGSEGEESGKSGGIARKRERG